MRCPYCNAVGARTKATRQAGKGSKTTRYRYCGGCKQGFKTVETAEWFQHWNDVKGIITLAEKILEEAP